MLSGLLHSGSQFMCRATCSFRLAWLTAVAALGAPGCPADQEVTPRPIPELVEVRDDRAIIAWHTVQATVGAVLWQPAGHRPVSLQRIGETWGPTQDHEVILAGLEPGRHYRYRLAEDEIFYSFRARPAPAMPLSLLLVWGDQRTRALRLLDQPAELLLSLTPLPLAEPVDALAAVRPYLQVFDLAGRSSPLLERLGERRGRSLGSWTLDWGGLRLIVLRQVEDPAALGRWLNAPELNNLGVIVATPLSAASRTTLEEQLLSHNRQAPQRPVAFVVLVGERGSPRRQDQLSWLPLAGPDEPAGAWRLDVEPDRVMATPLGGGPVLELRARPLSRHRTCEECQRLASQGKYEESLAAYREFLRTQREHYQVDDAQQAVAELLDQKLFRLAEAVEAYRELLERYPSSSLAPLARQRLGYLLEHADCGWDPLTRFEWLRLVRLPQAGTDRAARSAVLRSVEEELTRLASHRPACALSPRLHSWLASQLRTQDPAAAVLWYQKLAAAFPDHPLGQDALVEIAGTWYEAQRFGDAARAFRDAIRLRPELAAELTVEQNRAERNQRRRYLAAVGWLLLLLLAGAGVVVRPPRRGRTAVVEGILAYALLASILLGLSWVYTEQFTSRGEAIGLSLLLTAGAVGGGLLGRGLAWRLLAPQADRLGRRWARIGLGLLIGLLFLAISTLLALFHLNEHYLVVIGL